MRLIKRHTETDHLELGQWFHGRIYVKRGDLSPDGSLLVYFAAKYKRNMYSWTAVSRPPYLTALTMWDKGDCWWGGGVKAEHGYTGSYTAVKEVVREWERRHRAVIVPLIHNPGEAQVDFASAEIIRDGRATKVALHGILQVGRRQRCARQARGGTRPGWV